MFELRVPTLVLHLHHAEQDEDGVDGPPRLWLVHEQAELGGEGVLVRGDEGVDASGVVVEEAAVAVAHGCDDLLGLGAHFEQALDAVVGDEAFAEDFGDLSGDIAAGHIHLPEAVLGGDVALSGEEVVEVGGLDVRDAVLIAADGDFGGESGSWIAPSIWGREVRMACLSQSAPPPIAAAASRMMMTKSHAKRRSQGCFRTGRDNETFS